MLGGEYRSKCNTMGRRAERNHCKWTGSKIMWNLFSPFLLPLLHLLCNFPLRTMRKAVRITVSILFPYWGPARKNEGGGFWSSTFKLLPPQYILGVLLFAPSVPAKIRAKAIIVFPWESLQSYIKFFTGRLQSCFSQTMECRVSITRNYSWFTTCSLKENADQ